MHWCNGAHITIYPPEPSKFSSLPLRTTRALDFSSSSSSSFRFSPFASFPFVSLPFSAVAALLSRARHASSLLAGHWAWLMH